MVSSHLSQLSHPLICPLSFLRPHPLHEQLLTSVGPRVGRCRWCCPSPCRRLLAVSRRSEPPHCSCRSYHSPVRPVQRLAATADGVSSTSISLVPAPRINPASNCLQRRWGVLSVIGVGVGGMTSCGNGVRWWWWWWPLIGPAATASAMEPSSCQKKSVGRRR